MTETMELATVDSLNAVQVFTGGGLAAILDKIEATVRAIPLDVSTATGRDEIRSVAYKVSRTKTALDAEGKRLTEEWRKNTTLVNAERKKAQERLDALAEEIRKPLTDFENKEKNRVATHEAAIAEMSGLLVMLNSYPNMDLSALEEHLLDFSELHKGRDWEEFKDRATAIRRDGQVALIGRIESAKKANAERIELARLRQEETERKQLDRDEAIARQAAETARLEAERKANEAAEAERRRVAAEAEKVRQESERIQREAEEAASLAEQRRKNEEMRRLAAELRIRQAEETQVLALKKFEADRAAEQKRTEVLRATAEAKAASDLKASREKAKRDADAAVQREREKAKAERDAIETARLKREADEAHREKIRSDIMSDLISYADCSNVIDPNALALDLMDGKIRHCRVIF